MSSSPATSGAGRGLTRFPILSGHSIQTVFGKITILFPELGDQYSGLEGEFTENHLTVETPEAGASAHAAPPRSRIRPQDQLLASTGPLSASSGGGWAADQGSSAGRGWAARPSLWGVWKENGPSVSPGHHLCLREKEA